MADRTDPPRLGALEEQVMAVLWQAATALSTRQILDQLTDRRLAYTTVATVVGHLVDKGLVERVPGPGRPWLYRAQVASGEYSAAVMQSALAGSNDRVSSFLHFLEGMSEDDLTALRQILDSGVPNEPSRGRPDAT